jgi:hypothetical protein
MKKKTDLTEKKKLPPKEEVKLASLVHSKLACGGVNRELLKTKIVNQEREVATQKES